LFDMLRIKHGLKDGLLDLFSIFLRVDYGVEKNQSEGLKWF